MKFIAILCIHFVLVAVTLAIEPSSDELEFQDELYYLYTTTEAAENTDIWYDCWYLSTPKCAYMPQHKPCDEILIYGIFDNKEKCQANADKLMEYENPWQNVPAEDVSDEGFYEIVKPISIESSLPNRPSVPVPDPPTNSTTEFPELDDEEVDRDPTVEPVINPTLITGNEHDPDDVTEAEHESGGIESLIENENESSTESVPEPMTLSQSDFDAVNDIENDTEFEPIRPVTDPKYGPLREPVNMASGSDETDIESTNKAESTEYEHEQDDENDV